MLIDFCKLIKEGIGHTKRITWMMPEGLLLFLTSFAWKKWAQAQLSGCVSESL